MWHLQRSLYGSRASWGPSAARDHDHGHDLLRDLCCRSHLRHSRLILLSKATSATRLTTKGQSERQQHAVRLGAHRADGLNTLG